jgi:hypothetical protein
VLEAPSLRLPAAGTGHAVPHATLSDAWVLAPTFSWCFVTMAHALLGLTGAHVAQLRQAMGADAFEGVMAHYRADWEARGLTTPAAVGLGPGLLRYVEAPQQERLFFPGQAVVGGGPGAAAQAAAPACAVQLGVFIAWKAWMGQYRGQRMLNEAVLEPMPWPPPPFGNGPMEVQSVAAALDITAEAAAAMLAHQHEG